MLRKVIDATGVASSTADGDYDDLAFIYCVDRSGYCLSLSRSPDAVFVEVMVVDQIVHRTADVAAELYPDRLIIRLSPSAASCLDGVTEYVVPISITTIELNQLDQSLLAIFAACGRYERRF